MKNMQLIVLMGGKATRLAPLSYSLPKGLLSINQKPAIYNMLRDYVKNGLRDITFVVSPGNQSAVKSFLNKAFGMLNINFVVQENPQGPLHALALCRDYITKPTLLLLGDTLCETNLDYSYDWLGYMNITDNSHSRWCLIRTNAKNEVVETIDKPNFTPETNKVLIGLYNFCDPDLLREALDQKFEKKRGEYQLSSMIEYYASKRLMKGLLIKSWVDTGTLYDYNTAFKNSINGRVFNDFHLDDFGVLTKTSSYDKLKSEVKWLEKISKDKSLAPLIPAVYSTETSGNTISYQIEYIPGNSMAEYFMFYDIADENWQYIFSRFISAAARFWGKKPPRGAPNIKEMTKYMYLDKTLERIKDWSRRDILNQATITCNGETLVGFNKLLPALRVRIEKLVETSPKFYSIIHGDPCFSNVVYIPQTTAFKFIDPRGNFCVDTIYGDSRYDAAKIRHCYHGLYDYITQGMYTLTEHSAKNFEFKFLTQNLINPAIFDDVLERNGFDINDIELIEGLLFISMIPLHHDDKEAQVIYYLTGLKCLNNQLKENI
ncbi:MAG: hypothetical protein J6A98_00880 [Clostridia bacterium]|nr:hypothetical protein [Clostridia bacterium]